MPGSLLKLNKHKTDDILLSGDGTTYNTKVKNAIIFFLFQRVNSRLETINLGCNNMGSVGIEFLKDSLARNRTLLRLGLQATKMNCQGKQKFIQQLIGSPRKLELTRL